MTSDLDFDPELFGLWPKAPVYDGLRPGGEAELEAMARHVILDTKAERTSLDDLQDMLNGMTKELREQMQQFQRLRDAARLREVEAGEEIDRKLIQADAKASIEAMSLIVRTLEKIDSLQRTIAHDREVRAESAFDEEAYESFVAEIELRIEARAKALSARNAGQDADVDDDGGGARSSRGTAGDSPPGAARGPTSDEGKVP
ncbi:hypothetical protein [Pararhizobium sp. LjRoot238]|uniref:hypothetical protein n=1 Tax=Pararhizobium sp. LjRoot238 TaxID=3342293 RepID=UPI003ED0A88C